MDMLERAPIAGVSAMAVGVTGPAAVSVSICVHGYILDGRFRNILDGHY